jgi:hypothetical protein
MNIGPQATSIAFYHNEDESGLVIGDVRELVRIFYTVKPYGATPLSVHLKAGRRSILAMRSVLLAEGQSATIVLSKDGLPTNEDSEESRLATHELLEVICYSSLPVVYFSTNKPPSPKVHPRPQPQLQPQKTYYKIYTDYLANSCLSNKQQHHLSFIFV